jgi:hypothetical protein
MKKTVRKITKKKRLCKIVYSFEYNLHCGFCLVFWSFFVATLKCVIQNDQVTRKLISVIVFPEWQMETKHGQPAAGCMSTADALLFFRPLSIEIDVLCSLGHATFLTLRHSLSSSVQNEHTGLPTLQQGNSLVTALFILVGWAHKATLTPRLLWSKVCLIWFSHYSRFVH